MLRLRAKAVFIIAIVLYLLLYAAALDKVEPLTEFYVLNAEGKAEGYPLNLSVGEAGVVTIGIVNREFKETEYILVASYDGRNTKKSMTLRDNEKWEERFAFSFSSSGRHKAKFTLYKDGEEPYRRLHLWVHVRE